MNVTTSRSFFVVFIACIGLAACGYSTPIKKVEARAPIKLDNASKPVPLRARPVSVKMKSGESFGENGQGPGCMVHPGNTLIWRPENEKSYSGALTGILFNELQSANYSPLLVQDPNPSVGGSLNAPAAPMSDKQPASRANESDEILVMGVVKKITLNACFPYSVDPLINLIARGASGNMGDSNGSAYIQTDWEIYSSSNPDVVYRLTTEGSSQTEEIAPRSMRILFSAFRVAVRNLLADAKFYSLANERAANK